MSSSLVVAKQETQALTNAQAFTPEQLKLIRDTVAKGATPDELQLFLYRAKSMGLDPLKPGQVHFVKYGNSAGTIIVGIEGFRSIAHRSGKFSGIERGVKRDEKGKITHGWARVFRSDWTNPAYEESAFSEYDTGRGNWSKMPETMIKKVAECAALRMAFPNELGGVYAPEEMDQAAEKVVTQGHLPKPNGPINTASYGFPEENPGDDGVYRFPFGATAKGFQLKGLDMDRMHQKLGVDGIEDLILKFEAILEGTLETRMVLTEQRKADLREFIAVAESFIESVSPPDTSEEIPF